MNSTMMKTAFYSMKNYLRTPASNVGEQCEKTIVKHGLAAAAAAVAAGFVPGAGGVISIGICFGFVWAMYYRLAALFNIKISKNILKTIASVAVAEITAYLIIVLAATTVLTFIPGLNIGAATLCAMVNFGMVYIAGYLYIQMLTKLFKAGKDPDQLTEDEWKNVAKATADEVDMDAVYQEAKDVHKQVKNDKEYQDYKDVDPFE